ncbi:MAG: cupin domain-containing protein [Isosphaeraceae bacterium]
MSELSRRGFIGSAAAAASLAGLNAAADEELSFKNNVPDPLLAGDELPTFKFELEKSEGKVIGGSYGKEATVKQLPISKGIAGVSMRLEPGAMRELHWHATAAEWAFVIEGRVRTTVIDPQGRAETNDFEPGDIWYFPRGHGHMLECLGNKPAHFILIFDNGYFSEFGTFSITDWIGHTSKHLLAKNFGLPESAFEGFPKDEVYFARGPIPAETIPPNHQGPLTSPRDTHRYRMLAQEPHSIHKGGREWRVGADRFPISKTVTGVILDLEPGGLRELHWHPTSDEWQYVIEGQISVTLFGSHGRYRAETLNKGDVGYIPQGYGHSIENVGGKGCRVLIGFNTGHYEAIDLSMWIAGNPLDVLATNFGKPRSLFEKVPRERIFISPTETPRHGDRELD